MTLASSIRRRPNAFNLLHQMEVMLRGGYSGDIAIQNMEAGKRKSYTYIIENFVHWKLEIINPIEILQYPIARVL